MFFNKTAWGLAMIIALALAVIIALSSAGSDEPQPDAWQSDCQYQWVEGPYGKTLVCR